MAVVYFSTNTGSVSKALGFFWGVFWWGGVVDYAVNSPENTME